MLDGSTGVEEAASNIGRPSGYDSSFCQEVIGLCERGATDEEIAQHFEISTRTLYRWKAAYPEFCQAIQAGKDIADERVERSLYHMAVGTYVKEQQAHKVKSVTYEEGKRAAEVEEIKIVEVERYLPPEVQAASFWLKNRRSSKWKDRLEQEHTHRHTLSDEFEQFIRQLTCKPRVIEARVEEISSVSQELPGGHLECDGK